MLLGTYEKACVPWSPKVTPWNFGTELLTPDLDRIAPSLEIGFQHFPGHGQGRHQADHQRPLHFLARRQSAGGADPGPQKLLVACAVMAGFSQGGGVGLALSQWMVEGDPGFDVWAMDVARFGEWATRGYTNAKVRENYARRPRSDSQRGTAAARPQQTTALYDVMIARAR